MEEEEVDFYLKKIRNFDGDFAGDVYLSEINQLLLQPTIQRLERVQRFIGHGNFNLIGFDEMIYFARNYEEIGAFDPAELAFMEKIFFNDATDYGFFRRKGQSGTDSQNNLGRCRENRWQWSLSSQGRFTKSLSADTQ